MPRIRACGEELIFSLRSLGFTLSSLGREKSQPRSVRRQESKKERFSASIAVRFGAYLVDFNNQAWHRIGSICTYNLVSILSKILHCVLYSRWKDVEKRLLEDIVAAGEDIPEPRGSGNGTDA